MASSLRGYGRCDPPLDRKFPEAEISPLRRRIIEDMTVRNLSSASQQSYIHADRLRAALFLRVTLGCDTIPERIAYTREPRKLPSVLSADEVVRFLEAVLSLNARVALATAYDAGLRVSEVIGLKAAIDSDRMVIRIERGKGGKERYVTLSEQLLGILRSYWRLAWPESF